MAPILHDLAPIGVPKPDRPTTPYSPSGTGQGHYGLRLCTSTSWGRETQECLRSS
jgi:hypothetical protein